MGTTGFKYNAKFRKYRRSVKALARLKAILANPKHIPHSYIKKGIEFTEKLREKYFSSLEKQGKILESRINQMQGSKGIPNESIQNPVLRH